MGFSGASGLGRRSLGAAPMSGAGAASEATHLGGLAGLSTADEEGVDGHLGLGELAQLTVNNEAEVSYDVKTIDSFTSTLSSSVLPHINVLCDHIIISSIYVLSFVF